MPVVIAIIAILGLAAATLLVTTNRRRSTTGSLSRETKQRDLAASATAAQPGASLEVEAEGRARSDETRATLEGQAGLPAVPQPALVARWEPVDEEELGISRRQFLNRGILTSVLFATASFGVSVLAFVWPSSTGGFGSKVKVDKKLDDILAEIAEKKKPYYVPEARTYIVPYPADALPNAKKVYDPSTYRSMEQGIVALYQKCVHLGCRVPWCDSSQWFECPCHGSRYNRVGEKKAGPAPRGLDHFGVEISGGEVVVNSGLRVLGPSIGTNTTGQPQEGPSCL